MHSKATQASISSRRAKLIKYRREGVRYDDPRITGPESDTCLGYSSVQGASKDLIRALEEARDAEKAEASVYRQQENERLDSLLEAVWSKATIPSPVFDREREVVAHEIDLKAVDTVLKLMDRRAKLNGLDTPVRSEITGADGGPLQMGRATQAELEALIGLSRPPIDVPDAGGSIEDADTDE